MDRVVFDTVVFVRALLDRQSHGAQPVFERADDDRLVVSPPVAAEIVGVVGRPERARRFTTMPGRDPVAVLAILAGAMVVEIDATAIPRVSRDPNDDMFLATAVVGGAPSLIGEDNDLLVLAEYERIRIVDAATFLRALDEREAADARNGA